MNSPRSPRGHEAAGTHREGTYWLARNCTTGALVALTDNP